MKSIIVVAALMGVMTSVDASCPNACSGHGRCDDHDRCICYQQKGTPWGQRLQWTGADCSLRTCPLGLAFDVLSSADDALRPYTGFSVYPAPTPNPVHFLPVDYKTSGARAGILNVNIRDDYALNRDDTIYVRAVSDGASKTFQYRFSGDAFFNAPQTATESSDAAVELQDISTGTAVRTGIYVYFDAITVGTNFKDGDLYTFTVTSNNNIRFKSSNRNTLHQFEECSGRGKCDTKTGRCSCFVGYTGEACQRTACPGGATPCSGHGVCQGEYRFVADAGIAGVTYKAVATSTVGSIYDGPFDWDKQYGCACDPGFRGPDCSLIECPSATDPLGSSEVDAAARDCSGRGVCNYGTGVCQCFRGFFGERCESQTTFV